METAASNTCDLLQRASNIDNIQAPVVQKVKFNYFRSRLEPERPGSMLRKMCGGGKVNIPPASAVFEKMNVTIAEKSDTFLRLATVKLKQVSREVQDRIAELGNSRQIH